MMVYFCSDSTAEVEGKGKDGCSEMEDGGIGNEKLGNMKKDDKKSEKEKELVDDITDFAVQENLPS